VFGNLKYDALTANGSVDPALAEFLNAAQPLWIAASTTSGEEEHVLSAFAAVRRRHPRLTLMIAPRHPERFDAVERLIHSHGYKCARRTMLEPGVDVLLLDSIGELSRTFQYADLVFMGGSLVPRGGHNILEPAVWA